MQPLAVASCAGINHHPFYQLVEVVVAAGHLPAMEPPAPESLASYESPAHIGLLAKGYQGAFCGLTSYLGVVECLHVCCGAVGAEGSRKGRQFLNPVAGVVVGCKEGEGVVACGCHLVVVAALGRYLKAAVQGVEARQVGLCAHHEDGRDGLDGFKETLVVRRGNPLSGKIMQYEKIVFVFQL